MRRIGVLTTDGRVDPYAGAQRSPYRFNFEPAPGGGLVLTNPPEDLLLNVESLENYYVKLPIYFWNTDRTSLVPDVRYLARAVPEEQVNTRLFDWLKKGPSPWLAKTVEEVPEDTGRLGSIVEDARQITVNLGALADVAARDRLAAQLHWTLWPADNQRLQLQLEGRDVTTDYRFPDKNLAAALPKAREAYRYAVVDGVLTRLTKPGQAYPRWQVPTAVNSRVISAAVAKEEAAFAVVREGAKGRPELYIWPRSDAGNNATVNKVALTADVMSRPIWLDRAAGAALVLADGKLWSVGVKDTRATPVNDESARALGKVTGVTVAPDGRRMALVIGGELYVAALQRQSLKLGTFVVGEPRKVPTSLDGRLREVAFLQEDMVVVSASGDKAALAQVTIDGAIEEVFPTNRRAVVANLTAYVVNGGQRQFSGPVMLDVDDKANQAFNNKLSPIDRSSLAPPPSSPPVSPAPSSSASPGPPVEPVITAACFEG
ncbi:LpqB family beta-propeller domain-containing protein [Catellatospora vulcania]|uniref:LpqB family beta-propeller domain-containing protein n=1 Tax=Catellatospora vulcania TaxID=1460450 RepID=UPI002E7AE1D6|nr:LpqB family beta-propeller domain-containing protein [Catellatospora vulcania]